MESHVWGPKSAVKDSASFLYPYLLQLSLLAALSRCLPLVSGFEMTNPVHAACRGLYILNRTPAASPLGAIHHGFLGRSSQPPAVYESFHTGLLARSTAPARAMSAVSGNAAIFGVDWRTPARSGGVVNMAKGARETEVSPGRRRAAAAMRTGATICLAAACSLAWHLQRRRPLSRQFSAGFNCPNLVEKASIGASMLKFTDLQRRCVASPCRSICRRLPGRHGTTLLVSSGRAFPSWVHKGCDIWCEKRKKTAKNSIFGPIFDGGFAGQKNQLGA